MKIGDFFLDTNSVENITSADYEKIDLLINAVRAFARSTHQCVYAIDYFEQNFLYVSESIVYWCGQGADRVKEMGYQFYMEHVPEKEQEMLLEINRRGFNFLEQVPVDERLDYTISYDFHLINGRKKRLVNHHLTPILLSKEGRIWFALCTITMSAQTTPGHIIVRKQGSKSYYEYALDTHKWKEREATTLSDAERDILLLSAQGYTMNEIADHLCKSVDTIKAYKRALFSRLQVKSITEALSYATNYKLL